VASGPSQVAQASRLQSLRRQAGRLRYYLLLLLSGAAGSIAPAAEVVRGLGVPGSASAATLDVYLPDRAADDPPAPGVVWLDPGRVPAADLCGRLAGAGYVCALASAANPADGRAALRFLRAHAAEYHLDPERLAVLGGPLALRVGLAASEPGAVAAVGDLYDESSLADVPDLVSAATPPVLIVRGAGAGAPVADQARELDRVLTAHGVPHELVLGAAPGDPGRPLRDFLRDNLGIAAHGLPVVPVPDSPRVQVDLDAGWKFYPADNVHGPEVGFDDSPWASVELPHTWNARDGEDGGANYRRGIGWYRRHLSVPAALAGRRLYLQFDGVSLAADVYVNGVLLGSHKGGFARFCLDASDALKAGQDNLVSVRVDNSPGGFPPSTADFTLDGGIYRPVRLLATNQIQVSTADFGSPGVFIDQTAVSAERADLVVRAQVENYFDDAKQIEIHVHVLDAAGREVLAFANRGHIEGGDAIEYRHACALPHPHLWDGRADPYLYSVRVDVFSGKDLVDTVTQPLGVRFFRVDPNRGFLLNGRPLDLHGVDRHQDRMDRGWAISGADEAGDFALVQQLGCTAVRGANGQEADSWYQRCDRAGIVAWAAIPLANEVLAGRDFANNARQQLTELIRQNYNHPSICFWGCGSDAWGDPADHVVGRLAELARAEDPARLSVYAGNGPEADARNWRADLTAFNHYAGWHGGEFTNLGAWLDGIHRRHPAAPIGLGEYGAGASIFQHQYPTRRPVEHGPFHPEEYQADLHEASWLALAARPFVWGKFVYCLCDFASDGMNEGDHPGRNDKGLVTYDRQVRKDAFFWYQANWSDEPVVYITSRRFYERHKPADDVKVYSSAAEVELTLNGASLGVRRSPEHRFVWRGVPLVPGENRIAATSQFGNISLTDAVICIYRPSP